MLSGIRQRFDMFKDCLYDLHIIYSQIDCTISQGQRISTIKQEGDGCDSIHLIIIYRLASYQGLGQPTA